MSLATPVRAWLLVLVFIVPGALGQATVEGVHLHWRDDLEQYAVRFHSDLPFRQFEVAYTLDGQEHPAQITVTSPGYGRSSVYGFRFPANATEYRIEDRSFAVRAPPPAPLDTVRVGFLSDIGMTGNTEGVLDAARAANVSALLAGGDLSYADGDVEVWDQWMTFMEPYTSDIPIITARGNHEARCLGRSGVGLVADCYTDEANYLARFDLPYEKLYYATQWGPLRIIVVDTEAYYPRQDPVYTVASVDPDEQVSFLADALQAPDGMWTLVMMHRPLYSSSGSHGSEMGIRQHMEPTLVAGGADLVLAGHDHAYERTWPVEGGRRTVTTGTRFDEGAPIYVMSGGGGQSLYSSWQPAPAWSAAREAAFHFTLIEADAHRLQVTAITPDGRTLDSFTIERAVDAEPSTDQGAPGAYWMPLALLAVASLLRRR